MDFFDNAVSKAKEAFDVACKKTNEVVSTGKQKFDIASLENKLSKDYEQLGKLYFEIIKDNCIENEMISNLVNEIKEKQVKIDELKEEINNGKKIRVCPVCYAAVNETAFYCSTCGTKITLESDENE